MKGGDPDQDPGQYYRVMNIDGLASYTPEAANAAVLDRRPGDPGNLGNPGAMDHIRLNRWAIVEENGDDSTIRNYYDDSDVRVIRTDNLQLIRGGG